MLTRETRDALMARENALRNYLAQQKINAYREEDLPAALRPTLTNEERGQIEIFDWHDTPPDRYFAYVRVSPRPGVAHLCVTFMGDSLGPCALGDTWRSNMGDKRRSVRLHGSNGREYVGTYYASTGDYCRLRLAAGSK